MNRSALFAELNISRSSFGSNGHIRALIEEADKRWFGEKETDTKAHKAARERSEKKVAKLHKNSSKVLKTGYLISVAKKIEKKANVFNNLWTTKFSPCK